MERQSATTSRQSLRAGEREEEGRQADAPFSSLTTSTSTSSSPTLSSSSFSRARASSSSVSAISLSRRLCSTCSARSSYDDWAESREAARSLFCERATMCETSYQLAGRTA